MERKCETPAGAAGQAFTPRRLTARPAESEHLEGKSTTPHYLLNRNKVCENSQQLKAKSFVIRIGLGSIVEKVSYKCHFFREAESALLLGEANQALIY